MNSFLVARHLQGVAANLRRNAEFLERLDRASSVELYASSFSHEGEQAVVMDYYSLLGLQGDPILIIPLPRLLEVLGLEFRGEWGHRDAADLLRWLKDHFQLRYTGTGDRKCLVGTCDHEGWEEDHNPSSSLEFVTVGNLPIVVENLREMDFHPSGTEVPSPRIVR
jgi:hypothetical protein